MDEPPHEDAAGLHDEPRGTPVPGAAPTPETLELALVEGCVDNRFFRRGPVAAHLLVSAGTAPRVIVAFPAGNAGVGIWFEEGIAARLAVAGPLEPVEREDGLRGVAALLTADVSELSVRGAVLGSTRALREYAGHASVPAWIEHAVEPGPPLRWLRTTLAGRRMELTLEPLEGTTAIAGEGPVRIAAAAGERRLALRLTALSDDPPLTPIPERELFADRAPTAASRRDRGAVSLARDRDRRALAFLSYEEQLCAGSWRFLTYFGRDTLLSVRLLMPVLAPAVIEGALGSVIERLGPDGEVAHEEDVGEWAAARRPGARAVLDYDMIDDDFLLAPVLAEYLVGTEAGRARAAAFLARCTPAGETYAAAVRKNLAFVARRARPFAAVPAFEHLVALRDGSRVGQWRDSAEGLGGGRVPYDVNAVLVPAALRASARLLGAGVLGVGAGDGVEALALARAWDVAARFFDVAVPAAEARARVAAFAEERGLDAAPALDAIRGELRFPALALDADGAPVRVMHSDDGFALLFGEPGAIALDGAADRILMPFPAGLRTPVGVLVANPAFAAERSRRALFTTAHYHGTVVWSWQQAMLAAGLARQLRRADLPEATRERVASAERALWAVIEETAAMSTTELWSFRVEDGGMRLVPFGQESGCPHADESNAAQLWSTVYLAVRPSWD